MRRHYCRLTGWASFQHQVGTPSTDDFLYDGAGQRVEQRSTPSGQSTTTTNYVLGGLEEDTSGTLTKYLGVAGLPSAVRVGASGALSYLASDTLGSVSAALDGSGNVTAAQLYLPYGGVRYSSGTMPTAKGFTGQRADAATGLDYYNARYYDAVAGQFTSADTVASGLSPYAYVRGNPETLTDPTGRRYECPADGCGGGGKNPPPSDPGSGNGNGNGQCKTTSSKNCGNGNGDGGKGDRKKQPTSGWGDVLREAAIGLGEAAAAAALMAIACSGAGVFCTSAIDASIPILLGGIRHLLLAASHLADILGAGLGSLAQVQLRGFMVAIDMVQIILVVVNLVTFGEVGATTFAKFADAAAGGLQNETELASLGFASSESEETPSLDKLNGAIKAMSGSEGRLVSMAGNVTSLLENSVFGALIDDTQSFGEAWNAYLSAN